MAANEDGQSQWEPPSAAHLAWLAERGLYPRAKRFGERKLIGLYAVPLFRDVQILELMVREPWWGIDVDRWWPYQPPGRSEEWEPLVDFYLSENGEELVGSYLDAPPNLPVTRMALVLRDGEAPAWTEARRMKMPDVTPIPERLLRLIWID
jgi:hypothetical protein